ncbi:HHL1 [Scenedesmus sp. PABB004]|nr:HHL1 [Scenedesmus sp. PABB004]
MKPPVPEVDPDNEEFCIFIRATSGNYQNWVFVSVVKGGSAANALVKSLQTEWGRKLYGRTLISNIGNAVYKDRDVIVKSLKNQIKQSIANSQMAPGARVMEPLLNQPTNNFEFAFKIRDKTRPGEFQKAEGLTIIPKESEIVALPLDKLRAFFSPDSLGTLLGGSS